MLDVPAPEPLELPLGASFGGFPGQSIPGTGYGFEAASSGVLQKIHPVESTFLPCNEWHDAHEPSREIQLFIVRTFVTGWSSASSFGLPLGVYVGHRTSAASGN